MIVIRPAGDTGWLVSLGSPGKPHAGSVLRARRLKARVDAAGVPGVIESHVGLGSVLVSYDPVAVNPSEVRRALDRIATAEDAAEPPVPRAGGKPKIVPLCTCHACAPDRDFACSALGLAWDEVVRRFCGASWEVWAMGFQPGCPILGPVPDDLNMPRLIAPRVRVPAGSVGIGGWQSGIYAAPSPSGWRLLGRTPVALFDPRRNPPNRFSVGDRLKFDPSGDHPAVFRGREHG